MNRLIGTGIAFWILLSGPLLSSRAQGEDMPSVARPRFVLDGQTLGGGTAFFLRTDEAEVGVVAVAAAHSFDLSELSRAPELEFRLGRTDRRIAVSSRFYSKPGRSFSAPGATLREDFVVFALDMAPEVVRVLELDGNPSDLEGARVRILGVPASIPQDEDDIYGTVRSVGVTRIEVDLDVPVDLRGWGGAPVMRHPGGGVIGILEAAWPEANTLRLGVAPMDGVRDAMARPLDGGLGRPFAAFPGEPTGDASGPALAAAGSATSPGAPGTQETAAPEGPATGAQEAAASGARAAATSPSEKPGGDAETPAPNSPGDPVIHGPFAISARTTPTGPAEGEKLLGRAGAISTQVVLEIEQPTDGAVVGDDHGAFVAGRALALLGEFKRFDVVLVLDTSGSTKQMTGADINGNGVVGEGGLKGIFGKTDGGDSILAAEVYAARQILQGLDPRNTRVALVTFAGEPDPPQGGIVIGGFGRGRKAAITEEPLTTDYDRVDEALQHVLERGPHGLTHMAEGLRTAVIELKGYRGGLSTPNPDSEKVILFFTDGQPTLPYDPMFEADNVKAVLRAADQANRAGVRVHSFAIGPEALEGPVAVVEIAGRTGGYFTPVRHPGDLVEVIENVSFANIERLEIRNLSTDDPASELIANADGAFSALVPLEVGNNRIEVFARAADGSEARSEVTIAYAPGAPRIDLPRELVAKRNRLLEQRLVNIRRGRIEAERTQVEQARKELQLEIERERAAAQARADQQRKELDLEVVDGEQ